MKLYTFPEPSDLVIYGKKVKALVEELSKTLPYPCTVKLDETNMPETVELLINEWVMIVLFLDTVKSLSNNPRWMIKYSIEHIEHYQSHSRMEPDDVDAVVDITVDSPWKALREAFKLLMINDLNHAIEFVNMEERAKEEPEGY